MVSERNEEIAIRRVIEDWASAVRARDINGVLAHHTDDVLMYDVPPPTAVRGISAYRETWPPFFKALAEGGAAFDIVELQIAAGDTVGFATALLRCGSKEELAKDPAPRLRLTICLRKEVAGDAEDPPVLRMTIDAPPAETREQWLARTARERGITRAITPAIVGPATRATDGLDDG